MIGGIFDLIRDYYKSHERGSIGCSGGML